MFWYSIQSCADAGVEITRTAAITVSIARVCMYPPLSSLRAATAAAPTPAAAAAATGERQ